MDIAQANQIIEASYLLFAIVFIFLVIGKLL
ncbi:hypothetical protein BegalDRAFT_3189 [Beggiatoa alba B18LD]|uniref:Uncharacterized protein n=1 Tax=Beggiatoa alba B18LD TaxID=395493 RepID=I3CK70_9GAMM|nr:hypothetical protein BegalDRAFT_3189 [Beggiatoa alba B18LD]